MSTTKISHEIPINLFGIHDFINSYPYVLAHLLMKDTEHYNATYAQFYKDKLKTAKFSILDNSLYELGDAIDYKILHKLSQEYKPTHLILPDCRFNREVTTDRAMRYLLDYRKESDTKFIGVLQGNTLEELYKMYYFYSTIDEVDLVALSIPVPDCNFDEERWKLSKDNPFYKLMEDIQREYSNTVQDDKTLSNEFYRNKHREINYNFFRIGIIKELIHEFEGALPKQIHLLGSLVPNEFQFYSDLDKANIHSIDTSAPIVYGWNGLEIPSTIDFNLSKPKDKIAENLDRQFTQEELDLIAKNVRTMRDFI